MSIAKLVYPVVFFLSGLTVGVLWNPLERQHTPDSRAVSDVKSANEKYVAKMREMFGDETAEFVRQFEDMTIRVHKYPIDAWASPDGRFFIHLFGKAKTIASDLRQVEGRGGVKVLNRHYFFSCGDLAYRCDFARSVEDSKMYNVVFAVEVKGETKFSYVDLDADGLWDRFTDYTQEPSETYSGTYVRDGLCWKRIKKDAPKESGDEKRDRSDIGKIDKDVD